VETQLFIGGNRCAAERCGADATDRLLRCHGLVKRAALLYVHCGACDSGRRKCHFLSSAAHRSAQAESWWRDRSQSCGAYAADTVDAKCFGIRGGRAFSKFASLCR